LKEPGHIPGFFLLAFLGVIAKNSHTLGNESSFMETTNERFIGTNRELTSDPECLRWLQYLEDRYIVLEQLNIAMAYYKTVS
jgi:hypothetical protein